MFDRFCSIYQRKENESNIKRKSDKTFYVMEGIKIQHIVKTRCEMEMINFLSNISHAICENIFQIFGCRISAVNLVSNLIFLLLYFIRHNMAIMTLAWEKIGAGFFDTCMIAVSFVMLNFLIYLIFFWLMSFFGGKYGWCFAWWGLLLHSPTGNFFQYLGKFSRK